MLINYIKIEIVYVYKITVADDTRLSLPIKS
jgi:hypothetical protein